MKRAILGLVVLSVFSMAAVAQDSPHVTKAATAKFMKMPMLPQCTQVAAQEGDPMKGGAVILIKAMAGCKVPWHWHTAAERLYFVSGRGKIEMKDHPAESVGPADYVFLSAKGVHQFTCIVACTFFDVTDAAFDIHYVKTDGSEIPPEEALKAGKGSAKAAPKEK